VEGQVAVSSLSGARALFEVYDVMLFLLRCSAPALGLLLPGAATSQQLQHKSATDLLPVLASAEP
jgi:hypothetical protein